MAEVGNGEGQSPVPRDQTSIADQVDAIYHADVGPHVDETFKEKNLKFPPRHRKIKRWSRKAKVLTSAAALVVAATGVGVGVGVSGGSSEEHTSTGISQEIHTNPVEGDTDKALKTFGVESPDRLIVNPEIALDVAKQALIEVKKSFFAKLKLQKGDVDQQLDKFLAEAETDPGTLLTEGVYSYADEGEMELTTVIGMGEGSALDPTQPTIIVSTDMGRDKPSSISCYIDSNLQVLSYMKPHNGKEFSDYDQNKGVHNPLNNIYWTLSDLLGEKTDLVNSTIDRTPNPYVSNVVPTAEFSDNEVSNRASLDTEGFLTVNAPSGIQTPSFQEATAVTTAGQEAAVIAFALLSSDTHPSREAITAIPGITPEQQTKISVAVLQSQGSEGKYTRLTEFPVAPLVTDVFKNLPVTSAPSSPNEGQS